MRNKICLCLTRNFYYSFILIKFCKNSVYGMDQANISKSILRTIFFAPPNGWQFLNINILKVVPKKKPTAAGNVNPSLTHPIRSIVYVYLKIFDLKKAPEIQLFETQYLSRDAV